MPKRKAVALTLEFDPATGAFRMPGGGFPPRSEAELRTLRRELNVENPPVGVDTRPALRDIISAEFDKLRRRPQGQALALPSGTGGIWGSNIYTKPRYHDSGPHKGMVKSVWAVPAIFGVGLVVAFTLESIFVDMSNWWPGSALGIGGTSGLSADIKAALGISTPTGGTVPRKPASFGSWLASRLPGGADLTLAQNQIISWGGAAPAPPGYTGPTTGPGVPPPYTPPGPSSSGPSPSTPAPYTSDSMTPCVAGYTKMHHVSIDPRGGGSTTVYLCVPNSQVPSYTANGYFTG